jgi:hypothetical protein
MVDKGQFKEWIDKDWADVYRMELLKNPDSGQAFLCQKAN